MHFGRDGIKHAADEKCTYNQAQGAPFGCVALSRTASLCAAATAWEDADAQIDVRSACDTS